MSSTTTTQLDQSQDDAASVEKMERGQERTTSVLEVLVEDIDRLGRKVERITAPPSPYSKRRIGYIRIDRTTAARKRKSSVHH